MHVNIAFYFGFLKYFIVVVQLRYLLTGVCSLPIDSYQEFLYALFHPYLGYVYIIICTTLLYLIITVNYVHVNLIISVVWYIILA